MEFIPTKKHTEVSLEHGLSLLKSKEIDKLYSDGLCADEYIYHDKDKGFCYEDGCVIGRTIINTYERLNKLEWIANSNFYVENIKNNIEDKHLIVGIVMKPFLSSQLTGSIWDDLYVKQNFADVLARFNTNCIGIIPQGISLDRLHSNDIDLSRDKDLTQNQKRFLIEQINLCDGLILQGGLSSHKYEIFIAQYAIENNIPIIGICAGFNNIARAIGAEVEHDEDLSKKHDIYDKKQCHNIYIKDNANILSVKELSKRIIPVNSIHTITLSSSEAYLNNRINVEAVSKEKGLWGISYETVEAFSVKHTKFCLAIKWHPELLPNDEITNLLFKKFVNSMK